MQTTETKVWDPLIRTGHWLLATAVIIAWFVDEPLWLHTWLGYIAIALVLVRIVWDLSDQIMRASQASFVAHASLSAISLNLSAFHRNAIWGTVRRER